MYILTATLDRQHVVEKNNNLPSSFLVVVVVNIQFVFIALIRVSCTTLKTKKRKLLKSFVHVTIIYCCAILFLSFLF
jgi:hypothetical protein